MEFFEAIAQRRSCRRFTDAVVPDSVVEKALDAALRAPNSSNMQLWQFYWVKTPAKKTQLQEFCLSQGAARTASHLVVALSNRKVWRRNQKLIIQNLDTQKDLPKDVYSYYQKLVPFMYLLGPLSILGWLKKIMFSIVGLFKILPRPPHNTSSFFEMATKSTALACENLMLAVSAQGYATCPMEGFDETRVKKLLGLGCGSRVAMVIGIGQAHEKGIWGEQFRIPRDLTVFKI